MKDKRFWNDQVRESGVLSPADRISEVLFGLIMVLTFTGSISAANSGRQEVKELLWAALGCNVAWGLVDSIMYLMNIITERGHVLKAIRKIFATNDVAISREVLRNEMQPLTASLLSDEEVDKLVMRIREQGEPTHGNLVTSRDLVSGIEIFLLVFLCTLPVAIPFVFISEVSTAMRASNAVALLMLFIGGYRLAHYAGFRPFLIASIYAFIGLLLVAITMALGG